MDSRVARAKAGSLLLVVLVGSALASCRGDGLISGTGSNQWAPDAGAGPGPGPGQGPAAMPNGRMPNTPTIPGVPARGIGGEEMPADVLAILQGRCAGCHTYGQADPAGWGSALDLSRMIDSDVVVPGNPDASRLIDRIAVTGDMPPRGDRLSSEEIQTLRRWITGLTRKPAAQPLTDDDVLDEIAVDQLRLRDRSSDYRYVSFAHFVGAGRSEKEMEAVRMVFSFVINSLSRRGQIVEVPTIDADKSIFRLQLSSLGWDEALWDTLTSFYPYCIKSDKVAHVALYEQLRTEAPVVRGDWLLATATKAPLYDELVDLPATVDELAARLGIDINDDINHPGLAEPDNLVRIGFRKSGVALHNRMIERHLGTAGQYLWVSYDFDSNEGDADLLENPLGPKDRDEQNFENTFQHAGGEVIFTMPNGLQGYMLVDAVGRKIAEAPVNIVRDPRRPNGAVANGISCYGCHGGPGILRPRELDEVARYTDTHIANYLGRELTEIEASYPRVMRPDVMAADATRYRSAVDAVPGGGPSAKEGEFFGFVAMVGQYEANVGFRGAAAEFNEPYESFRERVLANDFQNDALPRTPGAPLVLRDDFVCVYRDLVTKIRPNALFCDKTFDAAAVQNLCSSGRSNSRPPVVSPQPNPPRGAGGTSGRGQGGQSANSGSGGRNGAAAGTGGANASNAGTGGSSSSGDDPDAGASDGGRCVRLNGRRVCR